jgi:hypothetical protein
MQQPLKALSPTHRRCEIFTAVKIDIVIFRVTKTCSLVGANISYEPSTSIFELMRCNHQHSDITKKDLNINFNLLVNLKRHRKGLQ